MLPEKGCQILARKEAMAAVAENRPAKLEPAMVCQPSQTIRELQMLLVSSNQGLVVVVDGAGAVIGLVTLHDLLRAEVAMGRENAGSKSAPAM
jgi:CIC family chloride channel protein